MVRRLKVVLGMLVVVGAARASPYWVDYETTSGHYPEEEGLQRVTSYGGDQRSIEDGWLVMDGRADPRIQDYYQISRHGGTDPGPGEVFVMQWRLRIDQVSYYYDPTTSVFSDEKWGVGFKLSRTAIYSTFETGVSAAFEAGVPHAFDFRSTDMRTYVLSIDGVPAIYGNFWLSLTASRVAWGDGVYMDASLVRWNYFRFGVVSLRRGDVNCDGVVNEQDIDGFVLLLFAAGTDYQEYYAQYPECDALLGDMNGDGGVNGQDIDGFVEALFAW